MEVMKIKILKYTPYVSNMIGNGQFGRLFVGIEKGTFVETFSKYKDICACVRLP